MKLYIPIYLFICLNKVLYAHCNEVTNILLVQKFGPLWTHSCFPFEHILGRLMFACYAKGTSIQLSLYGIFEVRKRQQQILGEMSMYTVVNFGV